MATTHDYSFPFSPAEIERGAVYDFKLNHVVEVDDPFELVRTVFLDVKRRFMAKLSEATLHARSKNAGPFWIMIDVSFGSRDAFERYANAPALQRDAIGALYDVDASLVKRYPVPDLLVLKISYPRRRPRGGQMERDMHGGQQYIRLLDVEV